MEEDLIDYSFDEETLEAVKKFERMNKNNERCFFDVIEFESIIDYYIDSNNSSKAIEVADLAAAQHPIQHLYNCVRQRRFLIKAGLLKLSVC